VLSARLRKMSGNVVASWQVYGGPSEVVESNRRLVK
jgi:hypothetical protein